MNCSLVHHYGSSDEPLLAHELEQWTRSMSFLFRFLLILAPLFISFWEESFVFLLLIYTDYGLEKTLIDIIKRKRTTFSWFVRILPLLKQVLFSKDREDCSIHTLPQLFLREAKQRLLQVSLLGRVDDAGYREW